MAVELKEWDAAEVLTTPERIAAYLEEMSRDGDPADIAEALGDIARAGNMSKLARDTGMTRAGLIRSLSSRGKPTLETVAKVGKALGVRVTFAPVAKGPVPRATAVKKAGGVGKSKSARVSRVSKIAV